MAGNKRADNADGVKRVRTKRRSDDVRADFTIVAVPGTHKDQTKARYGSANPNSKQSRRLKKALKQKILLESLVDGESWRTAARKAGYRSVGAAYEAGAEAIADIPKATADEYRSVELARLDKVIRSFMPDVERRDADAANVVLRASAQRAKMLGLDLAEPEPGARIDIRLQAMIIEMVSASYEPGALEQLEAEFMQIADANQRSADRAVSSNGARPSGAGR